MTPAQAANFERLLRPRHIAFIGGEDAATAVKEAKRRGFTGDYWPVNPRRKVLAGVPCFASLDGLPEAPDAVFLAIPAAHVVETVRKLAEMGTGGIVCYAAGFKEAGDNAAEDALRTAAGDVALIGPNCYGLISYVDQVALWPFAHGGSCPGYGAAIVTQSGMFSSDITMSQRSLPLTHMISAGNQTVLALEDFVQAFCEKPEVRAIGLHIEGLLDIPKFERVALRALEVGKPIVALKTGRSEIGATLTVSHTGSLSGTNELYEALFRRVGVISVTSPAQLLETLKFLCVAGPPSGTRVAGFTCSGGGATMLADHAETIGLSFPTFDQTSASALTELLPKIATVSNPLDYTTPIWGQPDRTRPVFEAALDRTDIDAALLVQDYPAPGLDESLVFYRNDAFAFTEATRARGLPAAICATLPENIDPETRTLLIEHGIAPLQGLHEAANAIQAAGNWSRERQRILSDLPAPLQAGTNTNGAVVESEADSKLWLRARGMPIPRNRIVAGQEAQTAALEMSGPLALKMIGERLQHKTEAGALALNLSTGEAVADAVLKISADVERYDPAARTDCYLLEEMAPPPLAELIVSLHRDAQFGLAMTIGSGGVLVELIGDTQTILLPANRADIRAALERLRVTRLLQGYRGAPVADLDALAGHLEAFATSLLSQDQDVAEIEINPLFVYESDILAVDALLYRERN